MQQIILGQTKPLEHGQHAIPRQRLEPGANAHRRATDPFGGHRQMFEDLLPGKLRDGQHVGALLQAAQKVPGKMPGPFGRVPLRMQQGAQVRDRDDGWFVARKGDVVRLMIDVEIAAGPECLIVPVLQTPAPGTDPVLAERTAAGRTPSSTGPPPPDRLPLMRCRARPSICRPSRPDCVQPLG